jgi:hypothetical protein
MKWKDPMVSGDFPESSIWKWHTADVTRIRDIRYKYGIMVFLFTMHVCIDKVFMNSFIFCSFPLFIIRYCFMLYCSWILGMNQDLYYNVTAYWQILDSPSPSVRTCCQIRVKINRILRVEPPFENKTYWWPPFSSTQYKKEFYYNISYVYNKKN